MRSPPLPGRRTLPPGTPFLTEGLRSTFLFVILATFSPFVGSPLCWQLPGPGARAGGRVTSGGRAAGRAGHLGRMRGGIYSSGRIFNDKDVKKTGEESGATLARTKYENRKNTDKTITNNGNFRLHVPEEERPLPGA